MTLHRGDYVSTILMSPGDVFYVGCIKDHIQYDIYLVEWFYSSIDTNYIKCVQQSSKTWLQKLTKDDVAMLVLGS